MLSKELLIALIERRGSPEAVKRRIAEAIAMARESSSHLVALLPPELLALMELFIEAGLTTGYQAALLDVIDDVNGREREVAS